MRFFLLQKQKIFWLYGKEGLFPLMKNVFKQTKIFLGCEPACEPPKAPIHGRVTPAKSAYRVKSHVVYECHGGYRLVGAKISYCNSDSKWSTQEVPQCILDTAGSSGKGRTYSSNSLV